jgi:regulator of sigma D
MSSFRLSQNARNYFQNIEEKSTTGEFDRVWDQYYLSAMAGIKARHRVPTEDEPNQSQEFVSEVIDEYSDQRYEIYSAMIVAEIEREAIPWNEKEEIRQLMLDILDSTSHTNLTDYGSTVLNCYAEHGFKIIESEMPEPGELDEFLGAYHQILSDLD